MSLMHEKYNSDDLLRDDPVWLFEQDMLAGGRPAPSAGRPLSAKWLLLAFAALSLVSAGLFYKYYGDGDRAILSAYFLVELRVIDNKGHPVPGAAIEMDGPTQGVTDTFGEWRSFVRLMPGGKLKVKVSRAMGDKKLAMQRTVSIPDLKTRGQEPNVKVNITFNREMPDTPVAERAKVSSPSGARPVAAAAPAADPAGAASRVTRDTNFREDEYATASLRFVRTSLAGYDAGQMRGQMTVADELIPLLKKQLTALGVNVSERSTGDLALTLSYVPVTGHPGVVMINMDYMQDNKRQHAAFLKDAGEPASKLAQRIIGSIKIHLAKDYRSYKEKDAWYVLQPSRAAGLWRLAEGQILLDPERQGFSLIEESAKGGYRRLRVMTGREEPCNGKLTDGSYCILTAGTLRDSPPITGWRQLRIKTIDKLPSGAQLFASGFGATALPSGGWEYWGEAGGTHNITVIAGGRIVLRARVKDPQGGVALIGGSKAVPAAKKRNKF